MRFLIFMWTVFVGLPVVIAVVGLFFSLLPALEAARWPQVTGTVTEARYVENSDGEERPMITYSYAVNGRPYAARQFGLLEEWQGKLPEPGRQVMVSYDPRSPASTLEPEIGAREWLEHLFLIVVLPSVGALIMLGPTRQLLPLLRVRDRALAGEARGVEYVELTDEQWRRVAPLFRMDSGPALRRERLRLEAVLWGLRQRQRSRVWPPTPAYLVNRDEPFDAFQRWLKAGLFDRIMQALYEDLTGRGGVDLAEWVRDGRLDRLLDQWNRSEGPPTKSGILQPERRENLLPWEARMVLIFTGFVYSPLL